MLPEPGLVAGHHDQPANPLRALPEVEVRHEQPGRSAMLRRERLPLGLDRDPGLPVEQLADGTFVVYPP